MRSFLDEDERKKKANVYPRAIFCNPLKPLVAEEGKGKYNFIYTHHARERMAQRGANDNEVEDTILTGQEVPAKGGKQKFEKTYNKSCAYNGKLYDQKKVEVVTAKDENDWVIVTVIADCK